MAALPNFVTFILIALGTVAGLAGTDLVLPAVPILPDYLGGDLEAAQFVLAAFAAGTGIGLLLYGELGTRFGVGRLTLVSLFAYAGLSLLATFSTTLVELSIARLFQGIAAAGPAVFAPVMIKSMYDETASIVALGRIGSIESMTPALAPILGAWFLTLSDWKLSFYVTAAVAALLSIVWLMAGSTRQRFGSAQRRVDAGYVELLSNQTFLRHALSQAFTLGALLIIVFAAPTMVTQSMGGELSDFIVMQVTGIVFFVIAANTSHRLIARYGDAQMIFAGTMLAAFGCVSILVLGLLPSPPIPALWVLFVFVNLGLGIRGPAGFFRALQASGDNDSRGSALIILFVMMTTAVGTAAVAPFVTHGLVWVAGLASVVAGVAVWLSLPRWER